MNNEKLKQDLTKEQIDKLINFKLSNKSKIIIVPYEYISYTRNKVSKDVIIRTYFPLDYANISIYKKQDLVMNAKKKGANHIYLFSNENFIFSETLFLEEINLYQKIQNDNFTFTMLVPSSWNENIKQTFSALCHKHHISFTSYEENINGNLNQKIWNYIYIFFILVCIYILISSMF